MTNVLAVAQGPLGFVEVLRDYGVEEFGSLYIYLPLPRKAADQDAWAWLETARLYEVTRGGPWRVEASRAPKWLRKLSPKLTAQEPVFYEVHRLDRERLATLLSRLS